MRCDAMHTVNARFVVHDYGAIRRALIRRVLQRVCTATGTIRCTLLYCAAQEYRTSVQNVLDRALMGEVRQPRKENALHVAQCSMHCAHGRHRRHLCCAVCCTQAIMNYELPLFHQNGAKIEVRTAQREADGPFKRA